MHSEDYIVKKMVKIAPMSLIYHVFKNHLRLDNVCVARTRMWADGRGGDVGWKTPGRREDFWVVLMR